MKGKSWTIHELLKVTTEYLDGKGIESPRLSAEILLAHLLRINRVGLYLNFDRPLDEEEISGYRSLIRRRLSREPVQHITGEQEFWSLSFVVGPDVLIPRPETELLVEQVVALYRGQRIPNAQKPMILDLGTGCGALAVALCREIGGVDIWASDLSGEALKVARLNAERHGVEGRISFRQGDLLAPFAEEGVVFDIIVSNPPYIATDALSALAPEVRDHEPRMALDGGKGGMDYIERIIRGAPARLNPGGWLLLEMDPEQTPLALALIDGTLHYGERMRIQDYTHRFRVVMAQRKTARPDNPL